MARIESCLEDFSGFGLGYWEELDFIPWLDPGPLRRLSPEKRDILISLGISELARNLSDPEAGRRLERLAAETMHEAAKAALASTRGKRAVPASGASVSTRVIEGSP